MTPKKQKHDYEHFLIFNNNNILISMIILYINIL